MTDSDAVFVPLTLTQWRRLVADGALPGPLMAYGVTPGLRAWGEFGPDEEEDARFAAQSVAGVAALTLDTPPEEPRIVLAVGAEADVASTNVSFRATAGSSLGEGTVALLGLRQVQAVFADEPGVPVASARVAARSRTVEQAWDDPVVAAFSEDHDLGWFVVSEARDW